MVAEGRRRAERAHRLHRVMPNAGVRRDDPRVTTTPPEAVAQASGGLAQRIEAHLGSRDVARIIYGAVVGLALVVALERHPPQAGVMVGVLVGSAIAIGLAELYSEAVSLEARSRRPVGRRELRPLAGESAAVIAGAGFPALFFVLAAPDAISLHLAFTLAKWSGLGLICGYGFLAARLAGATLGRGLAHGAAVGLIGGALIALKAVLH